MQRDVDWMLHVGVCLEAVYAKLTAAIKMIWLQLQSDLVSHILYKFIKRSLELHLLKSLKGVEHG